MYDAAIIGAGGNGLAAAAMLARAGRKVVVIERAARPGGRLVTEMFHPGFSASVFADRVAEIPPALASALGLNIAMDAAPLPANLAARRDGALAHAFAQARTPRRHGLLAHLRAMRRDARIDTPWPGADLASEPLARWPELAASAALGRALDPELAGSALALLAVAGAAPRQGGLGVLGGAFIAAAAGAEIRLGLEASEVLLERGRVRGVLLADGSRVAARRVISTLDFKRSMLGLFAWAALPAATTRAAGAFRMGGGRARLLLALRRPLGREQPLFVPAGTMALAAFRRGAIPEEPGLLIDPVSARDPMLAPPGAASVTVTVPAVPANLFDGAWTHAKRLALAARVLRRVEAAIPGTLAALLGIRIIVPPDIEDLLGVTGGDLDGGQLAPDQMLAFRPDARTALAGFYLGGGSCAAGPLGTGAAGFAAATALLADSHGFWR